MIIVIPSNRKINLEYFTPLIDSGARFIIVDDSEGNIKMDHPQFKVYNWNDRKKMLGKLDVGYPRKNGACRDFGFYVAWQYSNENEIIVALDDDCHVYHNNFAEQVEEVLSNIPRPVVSSKGVHLNILNQYKDVSENVFPRGYPYSSRVIPDIMKIGKPESANVTFNLGLWKGIFDVNAIDKISGPEYKHEKAELEIPNVILAKDKLISVCSMNMQFRKEVIPAVYQLPMHVEVLPNWVIDRYGDIWGGFILKTLMDIKGETMSAGEPMIHHLKEGNYTRNIWQEHVCHMVNDEFIAILLEVKENIKPASYLEMMKELNEGFKENTEFSSVLLKPYLLHLTASIDAWNKSLE